MLKAFAPNNQPGYWRRMFAALVFVLSPELALSQEYLLGSQDKIKLVVVEWRPSRAEAYNWTALNGEFVVSSAGMLTLPLVGTVRANGLTIEQLAEQVADQLQKRMGLVDRPSASIDIIQFRPFYVTGEVANPGEFPYRPGLTVLKALSIGGGLYRPLGTSAAALERDSTLARGDLRLYSSEQVSLRAKKARLEAEVGDKPEIDFPSDIVRLTGAVAQDAMREERLLHEARRSSVRSKIASLQGARALLEKEIATLGEKDANLGRQLLLAMGDRDNVKSLAGKGLVVASRQLSTEQNVSQMESARLDAGIARVRAEQDRAKIDRDISDLQIQRRAETLLELRQTEGKLNELRERLATSERLAFAAEVSSPEKEDAQDRAMNAAPRLIIVRMSAEGSREIEATYMTPVEPGDVVQVRRNLRSRAEALNPPAAQDAQRPVASAALPARTP